MEVEEVANSCASLVAAWNQVCLGLAKVPAEASPVGRDARQFNEFKPAGPRNVEYAPGQLAGLYVDTIAQHVLALESLARAGRGAVGPWPLIRAGLELAGRVAWLLEPDLGTTAGERRVGRFYLEMISSFQRDRYTSGKARRRPEERQAKARRDAKIAEARSVFDQVELDLSSINKIETWVIHGEEFQGLGDAADLFIKLCFTRGSALYDYLSDYSHPSLMGVLRQTTQVDADGVTRRPWVVGADVVEHQARLLCLESYKAAHLVAGYYAIDDSALERWASSVPDLWFDESIS